MPRPYFAIFTTLLLAGCAGAEVQSTEQMLAASGFAIEPATTPQVQNELAMLPPHQVMMRAPAGPETQPTYVYGDPDQCRCLYVGNAQNYAYFQSLAVQQQIAEENMDAAQLNENAALSYGMGPPAVVVVHEHR